jgi:hypothetical protein
LYDEAPVTKGHENALVLPPHTPFKGPLIELGVPGLLYKVRLLLLLAPRQLAAFTLNVPLVNVAPNSSVKDAVPCPETIDVLAGIVQV